MAIRKGTIEAAAKNNPQLKELLLDIARHLDKLADATGIEGVPGVPSAKITPPPQVKGLCVVGSLGLFVVNVTPATNVTGPVYYKFQSSETWPFESSTTVVEHGPTPQTSFYQAGPGETRFWRVFSRYASSDWTSPFSFPDPVYAQGEDPVDGGDADGPFQGVIVSGKARIGLCVGVIEGGAA